MYLDFTYAPQHLEDEVKKLIEETLVRRTELPIPAFELLCFLFASFFYYKHLDDILNGAHWLRVSYLFLTAARATILQKYAVIEYPWTSSTFTPYATGILPHVMMMSEIKPMKLNILQNTKNISDGVRD